MKIPTIKPSGEGHTELIELQRKLVKKLFAGQEGWEPFLVAKGTDKKVPTCQFTATFKRDIGGLQVRHLCDDDVWARIGPDDTLASFVVPTSVSVNALLKGVDWTLERCDPDLASQVIDLWLRCGGPDPVALGSGDFMGMMGQCLQVEITKVHESGGDKAKLDSFIDQINNTPMYLCYEALCRHFHQPVPWTVGSAELGEAKTV